MAKINDIKKLMPSERIKKLREIEEKRKKEIEETEKLIQESLEELKTEHEINELFSEQEIKGLQERIRSSAESKLEGTVEKEAPPPPRHEREEEAIKYKSGVEEGRKYESEPEYRKREQEGPEGGFEKKYESPKETMEKITGRKMYHKR